MKAAIVALIGLAFCASATPASAQWETEIERDPITDKAKARAWVKNDKGTLQIQCEQGDEWALAFQPVEYLGGSRRNDIVILRFDQDEPKKQSWLYLSRFAGTMEMKFVIPVLERLITAKSLTIRARKFDGANLDATFDNWGYNDAFVRIRAVCRGN